MATREYTVAVLADKRKSVVTVTPVTGLVTVTVGATSPFKSFGDIAGRKVSLEPCTPSETIVAKILCACYGAKLVEGALNKIRVRIMTPNDKILERILRYDDIPMDRLGFFVPFYRFSITSNGRMLVLDEVLTVDRGDRTLDEQILKRERESNKRDDDTNRFFSLFLPFHPTVERFQQHSVRLALDESKDTVVVDRYKDDYIKIRRKVPGIRLGTGDMVRIKHRDYIVTEISPADVTMESPPATSFAKNFDVVDVKGMATDNVFYSPEKKTLLGRRKTGITLPIQDGAVWFSDLKRRGVIIDRTAIVHKGGVEASRESEHVCVGDKTVLSQKVCEQKGHVWDRRCTSDYDCPFFDANQKTKRGACNTNGYCEMAIGVVQTGFTTYEGEPFCHDCPDYTDPLCCASASATSKYGASKYAFHTIYEPFQVQKVLEAVKERATPFTLDTTFVAIPTFDDAYLVERSAVSLCDHVPHMRVVQALYGTVWRRKDRIAFEANAALKLRDDDHATWVSYVCLVSKDKKQFIFSNIKDHGEVTLDKLKLFSHDNIIPPI